MLQVVIGVNVAEKPLLHQVNVREKSLLHLRTLLRNIGFAQGKNLFAA